MSLAWQPSKGGGEGLGDGVTRGGITRDGERNNEGQSSSGAGRTNPAEKLEESCRKIPERRPRGGSEPPSTLRAPRAFMPCALDARNKRERKAAGWKTRVFWCKLGKNGNNSTQTGGEWTARTPPAWIFARFGAFWRTAAARGTGEGFGAQKTQKGAGRQIPQLRTCIRAGIRHPRSSSQPREPQRHRTKTPKTPKTPSVAVANAVTEPWERQHGDNVTPRGQWGRCAGLNGALYGPGGGPKTRPPCPGALRKGKIRLCC